MGALNTDGFQPGLSRILCLVCCNICYNPSMNTLESIKKLNTMSSNQRGMFTAAQAKKLGVERYTLTRLEKEGIIERIVRGVYRMGGSPCLRDEDVFATWLSLIPSREPGVTGAHEEAPIAMGATAAWLQELGEIGPTPYEFCSATRKQTQRSDLIVHKRGLEDKDITYVNGMPVTAPSLTILDLIDNGEDLSLVANTLQDALERNLVPDKYELIEAIDSRGKKVGLTNKDSLYLLLTEGYRGVHT